MNRLSLVLWLTFVLLMQVIVFNNINFLGHINPYIYIVFVFLFPLNQNRFPVLFAAFIYGLLIDFFSDTGGIHAFSLLFVTYIRLFFVRMFFKKTAIDYPLFRLNDQLTGSVFNYVVVLTLIHHLILFSLANFSFRNIDKVLLNTIYSSIFTLIIYFLAMKIFKKSKAT